MCLQPLQTYRQTHAPNHVTCKHGVKNNYLHGILYPTLPIHCKLYGTTMTINGRLPVRLSPLQVWLENAYSRPKIEVFGIWPLKGEQYQLEHKKQTCNIRVIWTVTCDNTSTDWPVIFHLFAQKPNGQICTKFGTDVGVTDIINYDKFLAIGWGMSILRGVKILPFPIDKLSRC